MIYNSVTLNATYKFNKCNYVTLHILLICKLLYLFFKINYSCIIENHNPFYSTSYAIKINKLCNTSSHIEEISDVISVYNVKYCYQLQSGATNHNIPKVYGGLCTIQIGYLFEFKIWT